MLEILLDQCAAATTSCLYPTRWGGGQHLLLYQALTERGYTTEYQAIGAPKHLQGAVRLDALQTPGPFCLFSTTHEKEIAKVQESINSLEEELTINATIDRRPGAERPALQVHARLG